MAKRRSRRQPTKEEIQQICEGVGRVIISFALCEHALTMTLKKLLKLTILQERALVRSMSLKQKTSLMRRLARDFLSSTEYKTVNDILKDVEKHAESRNDLAHGFYGHKDAVPAVLTFSGDAKLSARPAPWTPKMLGNLAFEIQAVRFRVENCTMLFSLPLKLPKMRPPKPEFGAK